MGFRVWGLDFRLRPRDWGLGFRVWGLGLSSLGFGISNFADLGLGVAVVYFEGVFGIGSRASRVLLPYRVLMYGPFIC